MPQHGVGFQRVSATAALQTETGDARGIAPPAGGLEERFGTLSTKETIDAPPLRRAFPPMKNPSCHEPHKSRIMNTASSASCRGVS